MPALAPPAPNVFKKMLELCGYVCDSEGIDNWVMVCNDHVAVIPKSGDSVDLEIMDSILGPAEIDNERYFQLLADAKKDLGL